MENRTQILADKVMVNKARINNILGMEEVVVVVAMGEAGVEAAMQGAADKVAGGRFNR